MGFTEEFSAQRSIYVSHFGRAKAKVAGDDEDTGELKVDFTSFHPVCLLPSPTGLALCGIHRVSQV